MDILSQSRTSCFVAQDTDLQHDEGIRFRFKGPSSTPAAGAGRKHALDVVVSLLMSSS